MEFLKKIFSKKDSDVLVVGGEATAQKQKLKIHPSVIFYAISVLVLFVAILFTYSSTSDLVAKWQRTYKNNLGAKAELEIERKNLQKLEALAERIGDIEEQQLYIDQAIPVDPRYDEVIAKIESMAIKAGVETPESISWKLVPEGEISNEDFHDLDVYAYSFEIKARYNSFINFMERLRSSLRLMDIRSINGFKLGEGSVVSGTLVLWAYSIPLEE